MYTQNHGHTFVCVSTSQGKTLGCSGLAMHLKVLAVGCIFSTVSRV